MPRVALYAARYHDDPLTLYPLGLGYLVAYAIRAGVVKPAEICVVDTVSEAIAFKPDIVGVSAVSQVINDARAFARKCRKHIRGVYILGGYHVTLAERDLPSEFDLGVIGEGEHTFVELLRRLTPGGLPRDAMCEIKGVRYRQDGKLVSTPPRDLIRDLDSIPPPLRHRRYSSDVGIFTSRGCPCRCTYCAGPAFWGGTYRLRSAESVIDEVVQVVESERPTEVAILDDLWMANRARFRQIVEGLEARGIPKRVTFRGFCRANLVQEEDILLLKRLNCRFVRFGAETGSERLLKQIKGSSASVAHHQRLIDLCAKHGLPCSASFMFGIPGETEEDLKQTVAFLRANKGKIAVSGFYYFNPIPGTPLWDELVAGGQIDARYRLDALQLDMTRSSFDLKKVRYFNESNVPLRVLRQYIDLIRCEFSVGWRPARTKKWYHTLRSCVQ